MAKVQLPVRAADNSTPGINYADDGDGLTQFVRLDSGEGPIPVQAPGGMDVLPPAMVRVTPISEITGDGNAHLLEVGGRIEATADTFLSAGQPNGNAGASGILRVQGSGDASEGRSLIRFDFSGINVANIQAPVLRVYDRNDSGRATNGLVDVYAVSPTNSDWIEGNGTSTSDPASPGEPTWDNRQHPSTPWDGGPGLGEPGVGYGSTPLGTIPSNVGHSGWLNVPLNAQLLRASLEQGHAGFLLRAREGHLNTMRLDMDDRSVVGREPHLTFRHAEWVVLSASGAGARVTEGGTTSVPGLPIPPEGLTVPAGQGPGAGVLHAYVPTGVTVWYYAVGRAL